MKSLLVDVLREASKGSPEQTLSDSGSFDTTQREIPDTANDAVIEQSDEAGESFELYETTASLDADFSEALELTIGDADVGVASEPLEPALRVTLPRVHNNAPRLSRFAPLVCIALAAIASASWVGYQQLKLKYAESQFAMAQMGRVDRSLTNANDTVEANSAARFPFIEAGATVGEVEHTE